MGRNLESGFHISPAAFPQWLDFTNHSANHAVGLWCELEAARCRPHLPGGTLTHAMVGAVTRSRAWSLLGLWPLTSLNCPAAPSGADSPILPVSLLPTAGRAGSRRGTQRSHGHVYRALHVRERGGQDAGRQGPFSDECSVKTMKVGTRGWSPGVDASLDKVVTRPHWRQPSGRGGCDPSRRDGWEGRFPCCRTGMSPTSVTLHGSVSQTRRGKAPGHPGATQASGHHLGRGLTSPCVRSCDARASWGLSVCRNGTCSSATVGNSDTSHLSPLTSAPQPSTLQFPRLSLSEKSHISQQQK